MAIDLVAEGRYGVDVIIHVHDKEVGTTMTLRANEQRSDQLEDAYDAAAKDMRRILTDLIKLNAKPKNAARRREKGKGK